MSNPSPLTSVEPGKSAALPLLLVCGAAGAAWAGEFLLAWNRIQAACGQTLAVELATLGGIGAGSAWGARWWSARRRRGQAHASSARRRLAARLGGGALAFAIAFLLPLPWPAGLPWPWAGSGPLPCTSWGAVLCAGAVAALLGAVAGATLRAAAEVVPAEREAGVPRLSLVALAALVGGLTGFAAAKFALIELGGFTRLGWAAVGLHLAAMLLAGFGGLTGAPRRSRSSRRKSKDADRFAPREGPRERGGRLLGPAGWMGAGILVACWSLATWRALDLLLLPTVYFRAALTIGAGIAFALGMGWAARQGAGRGVLPRPGSACLFTAMALALIVVVGDPRRSAPPWAACLAGCPAGIGLGWLTVYALEGPRGCLLSEACSRLAWWTGGLLAGSLVLCWGVLPYASGAAVILGAALAASIPWWLEATLRPRWIAASLLGLGLFVAVFAGAQSFDAFVVAQGCRVYRDARVTAVVFGEPGQSASGLAIGGVGRARPDQLDKVSVHLAGCLCRELPRRGLVIGAGLGTGVRSLKSWGMDLLVVDASPALLAVVRDQQAWETNQSASAPRLVNDDPRRVLRCWPEPFDLIVVDPPRPLEWPGATQVLSSEFFAQAGARLSPSGVFQLWMPESEPAVGRAVLAAMSRSFAFVRVFRAYEGTGMHYLASNQPFPEISPRAMAARMPAAAQADLLAWSPGETLDSLAARILAREANPGALLAGAPVAALSDDRPIEQYYALRRGSLGAAVPPRPDWRQVPRQ